MPVLLSEPQSREMVYKRLVLQYSCRWRVPCKDWLLESLESSGRLILILKLEEPAY